MKNATLVALLAYLEALKGEGYTHVHLSSVIPMGPQTPLKRRQLGLEPWTQFPDIAGNMPEGMAYDRMSGMVYFDYAMFVKARASR